MFNGNF
jgi:hypothetical protein